MIKKTKVLFVSQEITPFVEESEISTLTRKLPQAIQEKGKDIRTFMPRFGTINERRHQLHEVIRLSGMNLIIDNSDHPLIIKVASITPARMQVYFIDNDEYFQRKSMVKDAEGAYFADNEDRSIFFCRGVLETVKKLGWSPDVIHCHGWMTSLLPLLIKTAYSDDPVFANTKTVYSVYNDAFDKPFSDGFSKKLRMDGITAEDVKQYKKTDFVSLSQNAMKLADAVIKGSPEIHADLDAFFTKKADKPVLPYKSDVDFVDSCAALYDELVEEPVAV